MLTRRYQATAFAFGNQARARCHPQRADCRRSRNEAGRPVRPRAPVPPSRDRIGRPRPRSIPQAATSAPRERDRQSACASSGERRTSRSRYVPTMSMAIRSSSRATNRSISNDEISASCRSSRMMTSGPTPPKILSSVATASKSRKRACSGSIGGKSGSLRATRAPMQLRHNLRYRLDGRVGLLRFDDGSSGR